MKKMLAFLSAKKEAFLLSLAMLFVSTGLSAQIDNIGETLLTDAESSFKDLIDNIISFLQVVIVIGGIAMLVMVIFKIFKGDREAAEKFAYWLAGFVLGFALLSVLGGIL